MSASDAKDYYGILGVEVGASFTDIKKAYRKQALTLHPDKNVGREKEVSVLFDQLRKAYAFLSDDKNRQVYEAQMQAKAARSKKQEQETGQIKAMREALERREAEFKSKRMGGVKKMTDEESSRMQTAAIIQQMREQGILKSSQRRAATPEPSTSTAAPATAAGIPAVEDTGRVTIKVKWASDAIYTDADLRSYFELFGDIDQVAIRKRTALIAFRSAQAANAAVANVNTAFPGLFKVDLVRASQTTAGDAQEDDELSSNSTSGSLPSVFAPARAAGVGSRAGFTAGSTTVDAEDAALREMVQEEAQRKVAESHDDKERLILERMRKAEEARQQRLAQARQANPGATGTQSSGTATATATTAAVPETLEPTAGAPFFRPHTAPAESGNGDMGIGTGVINRDMNGAVVGVSPMDAVSQLQPVLGKRKLDSDASR